MVLVIPCSEPLGIGILINRCGGFMYLLNFMHLEADNLKYKLRAGAFSHLATLSGG